MAFPSRRGTKRPALGVRLSCNNRSIQTFGIVDSGADDCVFPASLARSLGITIPNERRYVFSGAADNAQFAFFDVAHMDILDFSGNTAVYGFDLDVGFTAALDRPGFGLLGQNGFFSRFKITFDHVNDFIELDPAAGSLLTVF